MAQKIAWEMPQEIAWEMPHRISQGGGLGKGPRGMAWGMMQFCHLHVVEDDILFTNHPRASMCNSYTFQYFQL